ncbi:hypothetical protein FEM48_Zijuj01G0107200 [Ziziphus jujuba var. spinosa]|uniref:DUF295 domain-containing protein n=1 Tax=Ziziphus jujuba var. spinosa TaxID=714518 RepID=A0A978W0T3_ZIZJJ|nr:hypothetical protein FEM48_Zijuj01G0107200 [Ziziphus jujuba var. spinosa]
MDSTTSNWSTLRTDMPEEIAKSLDTHTEILHLHAVYSSGYSSVPLLPEILTLKLSFPIGPDNNSFHPKHRGHYFLKKSTFYCLEPLTRKISSSTNNSNWFVRIEDAHDSRKVRFKDPLSKFTIKKLGKIGRLPHRAINLLDYKLSWVLRMRVGFGSWLSILVGNWGGLENGDEEWAKVDDRCGDFCSVDIAFHNKRFYAVDDMGQTIAIDPSSLEVTQMVNYFPGLKKNWIYFSDDSFVGGKGHFPSWKADLFDLEDDVAQPLKSVVGYSKIF